MRPEALVQLGAGGRGARRRAAAPAAARGFMGVEPELDGLGLVSSRATRGGLPSWFRGLPGRVLRGIRAYGGDLGEPRVGRRQA